MEKEEKKENGERALQAYWRQITTNETDAQCWGGGVGE